MVQKEFLISNESGLHTRPGNDFVKLAKEFDCAVSVTKGDKTVDGKSLLKLMKANVMKGDKITVVCDGTGEEYALDKLGSYLESLKE